MFFLNYKLLSSAIFFKEHPYFSAILITLGVLLLGAFVTALIFALKKDNFYKKITSENSVFNIRVYKYDFARKKFYSFDKMNLTNCKEFTEEQFLAQFARSDSYRISDWLNSLIQGENPTDSLQVETKINHSKKNMSSILHFTSINKEKQILHFESQLLPFMRTYRYKKFKESKFLQRHTLLTISECEKFLSSSNADVLGSIVYISVYTTRHDLSPVETVSLQRIRDDVIMIIGNYLGKCRKIYRIDKNDTVLIDISCLSKLMAFNIASSIHTALQQYLNFHSQTIDINIAIGISLGTMYQGNLSLGIEQSKKMAYAIRDGKTKSDTILLYDEDFFTNYEQTQKQIEEVKTLIKNSTFRVYYTPTINLQSVGQSMNLLQIIPYGTSFKDINETMLLSQKIKDGPEMLFGRIFKKVIREVKKFKNQVSIGIEIPYDMLSKFTKVLHESESNIKWVVCIRKSTIMRIEEDQNVVVKQIKELQKTGCEIGLIIDNISTDLRSRVLKLVNYIMIPNIFTCKATDPDQAKNDLRTILSAYSSYHHPFMFYGLNHIDDIETGIINEGTIFQCDEIALPSSKLEKIPQETIYYLYKDAQKLSPKRFQFHLLEKNIH